MPSAAERALGLWVDRMGEDVTTDKSAGEKAGGLRILGQYCSIVVLEGSGVYVSENYGAHEVVEGDCMLQFPEDPCSYYPHGSWTRRWITWNGPEARTLDELGYMATTSPVFSDKGMAVSRAYEQIMPIMHRGASSDALRRKTMVLQLVLDLYTRQVQDGKATGQPRIERALTLIHNRFDQDVAIPDLAGEVGLSTTHFRRQFRAYTGRSPVEYVRELRMAEAARLLSEGEPIKQVAAAVGYEDAFYFMRVFRKTMGMPPGQYARRSHAAANTQ